MRTEKALKNIVTSLLSYVFLFGVGLVARRLLLDSFDTELVGYDGLLADIFSFIALADFGADGLFTYRLYEAFAKKDDDKLKKIISLYKSLFIVLGTFILIVCIILSFFLPIIFKGKIQYWGYFYLMYFLYALASISSYYFGYWRAVLVADQMEYKAIKIETLMSFISMVSKIVVLFFTKNYLFYLIINTVCTVLSRVLVSEDSRRCFKDIKLIKVRISDFLDNGMLKECKDIFIIKISETITWCSTNLLTSLLIGVSYSTYYYNYSLIGSTIYNLISKLIKTATASIADMVYTDDVDTSYEYYKIIEMISFFTSSIILVCFFNVFQSTIRFVYGEEYLLSNGFLFCYSLLYYITTRSDFVGSVRNCFGEFNIEKKGAVIGMFLCVAVAVLLAPSMGITGIVIGTIVSVVVFWLYRLVIVIKNYYSKSLIKQLLKEALFLFISFIELLITYFITINISFSLLGIIVRGLIGVGVCILIDVLLYLRKKEFVSFVNYAKQLILGKTQTIK